MTRKHDHREAERAAHAEDLCARCGGTRGDFDPAIQGRDEELPAPTAWDTLKPRLCASCTVATML